MIEFVESEKPDILCLQEVKANREDLPEDLASMDGYNLYLNSAEKKGYSGVAVYTKKKPIAIQTKLGLDRFDREGRILELEYSDLMLVNLYFPHGGRQKENLEYKLEVYKRVFRRIEDLKNKDMVLIGDFNIAHEEIDLARPKENRNNIMFTTEERGQLDELINLGLVDSFRKLNETPRNYTWWPYAFNAKERNMGWRIDYAFVSRNLSNRIKNASIYPRCNFSDHCPIGVEII